MQKTKESENERVAVIPEGGFLPVGRQQFELLVVVAGIHVLDQMVSDNLTGSGVLSPAACKVVSIFESVGGILFVLFGIVTITAIICSVRKAIIPAMAGYLFFALIHLLVNMGSLLLTADSRRGQPLSELWDVVTIYFMGVSVFTSWYWFLDRAVPSGALIFPSERDLRTNHGGADLPGRQDSDDASGLLVSPHAYRAPHPRSQQIVTVLRLHCRSFMS